MLKLIDLPAVRSIDLHVDLSSLELREAFAMCLFWILKNSSHKLSRLFVCPFGAGWGQDGSRTTIEVMKEICKSESGLKHLCLRWESLHASIPALLPGLACLRELDISFDEPSTCADLLRSLHQCRSLEALSIEYQPSLDWEADDTHPAWIGVWKNAFKETSLKHVRIKVAYQTVDATLCPFALALPKVHWPKLCLLKICAGTRAPMPEWWKSLNERVSEAGIIGFGMAKCRRVLEPDLSPLAYSKLKMLEVEHHPPSRPISGLTRLVENLEDLQDLRVPPSMLENAQLLEVAKRKQVRVQVANWDDKRYKHCHCNI